jgi:hypothetical protein
VQVTCQGIPVGIDVLRVNRDAVGILTTEDLPIRQAASRCECGHTATNAIGKQVVVIRRSARQRAQTESVISRRARGVAAPVPENVVLIDARAGCYVADETKGAARRSHTGAADINTVEINIVCSRNLKHSVNHIARRDRVAIGIQTELHHVVLVGPGSRHGQDADQLAREGGGGNRKRMDKVPFHHIGRGGREAAIERID